SFVAPARKFRDVPPEGNRQRPGDRKEGRPLVAGQRVCSAIGRLLRLGDLASWRKMRRRIHQPQRLRVMGRLSAVVPLVVLLLACGCEQEKKAVTVTRERSQAVQASSRTPPATEQAAQAKALPTPAEATPRPPRR